MLPIARFLYPLLLACLPVSLAAADDLAPPPDKGDFSAFIRSVNDKPYGYEIVDDPTGTAPAKRVERFEVRAGDCGVSKGWSDCARNRERSELREGRPVSPAGSEAWYGWWFYLPETWPDVWPTKTVIGQFHQWRANVIWMFLNYRGGLWLDDMSGGGTSRRIPLIAAATLRGRWHRVEVHARWARDKTGFLRVWIDGVKKADLAGSTMTADTVYFRYGVYRSFVSRYERATGKTGVPTQWALFAKVRKAKTREGLD